MLIPLGYQFGVVPPNRCSKPFGHCSQGDSEKEPLVAAHNVILAHAAAVKLYKTKYQTGMNPPLRVYPPGMEKTVTYIKERYNNSIPIIITENGYCELSNQNSTIEDSINDVKRIEYLKNYLDAVMKAMRKGADVRGYFIWTLLDTLEWNNGCWIPLSGIMDTPQDMESIMLIATHWKLLQNYHIC